MSTTTSFAQPAGSAGAPPLGNSDGQAAGNQGSAEAAPAPQLQIVAPQLLSETSLQYPEAGEGDALVALKLLIRSDGTVEKSIVIEGSEPFASSASVAALLWHFSPARKGGEARAAWIIYRVEFIAPSEPAAPPAQPLQGESSTESPEASEVVLELNPEPETEVSVRARRTPASARVMSDSETTIVPGAEGDPVRALGILPGTVPIIGSGPFIGLRGGPPGMVGYEYDGISLPYLFHLAGGTAVVHPWMVESATIYGTGGPARLGRSGGGTIEAVAAEPAGRLRAGARVRITDTALGAETPFLDGKGSILLAGRYSYTKPLVSAVAPDFALDYWDYQGKVRYQIKKNDSVEVLALGSGDKSSTQLEDGSREDLFRASFHRASLRYTHSSSDGEYQKMGLTLGHDRWDAQPGPIQPYSYSATLRFDSHVPLGAGLSFDYGADLGVQFFTDYYYESVSDELIEAQQTEKRTDLTTAGWVDWSWQAGKRTAIGMGLRLDFYESGETERSPQAVELAIQPRFSLSHVLSDWARLHQSVGFTSQKPSPAQRPPGREYAVHLGIQRSALSDLGIEWQLPASVIVDTTAFHNVYFNTRDIYDIDDLEGQSRVYPRGRGQAVGLEVALKRTFAERFRGFVSYTLSHSWRSLGRVRHPTEYDRPHVFDVALAYHLGKGWDVSARGTVYSGFRARVTRVADVATAPRVTAYYQVDWQLAKRWENLETGRWWGVTMGILNTTLNSEVNDAVCRDGWCEEDIVGPATVPTIGLEGEL